MHHRQLATVAAIILAGCTSRENGDIGSTAQALNKDECGPPFLVADRAADEVTAYLATDVPVGPHLADQLVLPLALAGGGRFRTVAPTAHTRTQLAVVQRFLGTTLQLTPDGGAWRFRVG